MNGFGNPEMRHQILHNNSLYTGHNVNVIEHDLSIVTRETRRPVCEERKRRTGTYSEERTARKDFHIL